MSCNNKPGLFIAVEGMDGCGKTTIVQYLVDKLHEFGSKTIATYEVGGTAIGKELRNLCFKKREDEPVDPLARLLMVYAARIQHIRNVIKPGLEEGYNVVTDRYNISTKVYQGILDQLSSKMDLIEAAINRDTGLGLVPNVVIFLDVDPDVAYSRGTARVAVDNDAYKNDIEKARKIGGIYRGILARHKAKYPNSVVYEIDANQSIEFVKSEIDILIESLAPQLNVYEKTN